MATLELADLYRYRTIQGVAVSPGGDWAAFVVSGYRRKENDSYQNLWLARTDGSVPAHRLTRGFTSDRAPAWSPDGRYLAFLSTRENELEVALGDPVHDEDDGEAGDDSTKEGTEEPKPQIWVLDLKLGGEPRQVTNREEGVSEFDWAPDSRRLVFASRCPDERQREYLQSVRGTDKSGGKGPVVVDYVQYKHDTQGYLDNVRTHLFTVELASRKTRQLTYGPCNERSPRWSPDGEWIVFVSNRTGDADNNRRTDLWLVRAAGGDPRRLTFGDLNCWSPAWSPGGRRIAFVAHRQPENAYVLSHLMTVDVDNAEPVDDLASFVGQGWESIGGVVPDEFEGDAAENARVYPVPLRSSAVTVLTEALDRPAISGPRWADEDNVVALFGDRGQTRLVRANTEGYASFVYPVDDRMCSLASGLLDVAGDTVVAGLCRADLGIELVAIPVSRLGQANLDNDIVPFTAVNHDFFEGRATSHYQRITYPDNEGQEVEAIVLLPPEFNPDEDTAPLIVKIHGGPMSYDTPDFRFDAEYWAGMGYLVLRVNYRGSISYGEDFTTVIRGDWGRREQDDVMSGVRAVIDRGWADPNRLFCTGFSQGGIMTNWAVGHTDRFRAAASEHSEWNYAFAYGTDDTHLWWQDDLGVPWQNPEQYYRISPVSGLENIHTPLLIMAGEHDWRCPLTQSEQLYVALKKRGVPTQLVIYQGERHAITRPRRAIDRIRRIAAWFASYGGHPLDDDSAEGYPDAVNRR